MFAKEIIQANADFPLEVRQIIEVDEILRHCRIMQYDPLPLIGVGILQRKDIPRFSPYIIGYSQAWGQVFFPIWTSI